MTKEVAQGRAWGDAHRREALARLGQIAAHFVLNRCEDAARRLSLGSPNRPSSSVADPRAPTERAWRTCLAEGGLSEPDIEREVARVRALAEGRLVRDTFVRVVDDDTICGEGRTRGEAEQHALFRGFSLADVRVVRVTRIRRAVKP